MPTYAYRCDDCSNKGKKPVVDVENNVDGYTQDGKYIFFKYSRMDDKESSPVCPKCGGNNTISDFSIGELQCWVRGNGLVNDKTGARRDMHLYKLMTDDPYPKHMRVSGEVDHIANNLRRGGMDMNKINSKHRQKVMDIKSKIKDEGHDLNDDKIKILTRISEGVDDFSDIGDFNKEMTELMPEYVCRKKTGEFMLMAVARKLVEELLSQD